MIILSNLTTDTLRKLYKELNPNMLFNEINKLSKAEIIKQFDKITDKRIKNLLDQVNEKYKVRPIKTIKDYLNSINKYDVRKIAKDIGVTGLQNNKGDLIKNILDTGLTLNQAKKILL